MGLTRPPPHTSVCQFLQCWLFFPINCTIFGHVARGCPCWDGKFPFAPTGPRRVCGLPLAVPSTQEMLESGVEPNIYTYTSLTRARTGLRGRSDPPPSVRAVRRSAASSGRGNGSGPSSPSKRCRRRAWSPRCLCATHCCLCSAPRAVFTPPLSKPSPPRFLPGRSMGDRIPPPLFW